MTLGTADDNDDSEEPEDICDLCGLLLDGDYVSFAVVADSSAVHDQSDHLDGQRIVLACCDQHLTERRASYERRPFVEAELWAGQIERARRRHPAGLTEQQLRCEAGLSVHQFRQAQAWSHHSKRLPPPRQDPLGGFAAQ
ncbi:hypothetical protein DN069_27650 [Streptacidiphilus pinicola]|uniref:Uncharacterized protein n=1 Tax=Streptacidiphilus pinicola TaxID=2219663 RepID=A0A2X0IFP8_9ACTN|nr:hypothetical protein [Streptacidiphilus pinicola]RAG82443.1 hypothetical protein DN069_27650 [Streptacidiphilus pinicola]